MNAWALILTVIPVVLSLISLGVGIYLLVRYFKIRKTGFLVGGLLLTFIVPGLLICAAIAIFVPSTMIAYGPPPPGYTP